MMKLACNVAAYRPDPGMLAARFEARHAETLLAEAERLLERCIADFREYSALDRAWQELSHDLSILEKELELDRQRVEAMEPQEREVAAQEEPVPPREETQEHAPGGEAEAVPPAAEEEAEPELERAEVTGMIGLRGESIRRRKELAGPGGPLAMNEQRDLVLKRLCRDYEAALDRIAVAEEGLMRIYGHDAPSPLGSWAETLGASIASCTVWTRDALEWIACYQRREQAFTRAFSVRALMNRNAWGQLRHARDSFAVRVQVPQELFQGVENCRFRGVSASLLGEAGAVPWSALVRLPERAGYVRRGERVEVDQRGLPPVLLGRVENRRSVRRSEFCGMVTHENASPVGKGANDGLWSVELFRPVGAVSEQFAQVEDLVVEVKVCGVPQAGGE
ncbi:hypothetical protein E4633_05140 [Geomonas terrae]|uniref:Uncharacterized protein n=1 Tax=Geomonas terrae TaxID=2562681 RepID=A0A4S1CM14_9BACT|nr:hypothetical protein [Geomonas terrae]TGU74848.1 hypothetical protein E4633_05140 [Geomonas terrae]